MVKHCYNCEHAKMNANDVLTCEAAQPAPVVVERDWTATRQYDWCNGMLWEKAKNEVEQDGRETV